MPVVEIAKWIGSDAFLEDKSLFQPFVDIITKIDGFQKLYWGIGEEDNKTVFLFIVWETLAHHKNLMAHPEYPKLLKLGPTFAEGTSIFMRHVEFKHDFIPALTGPVTEILLITLKKGKTKEELNTIVAAIGDKINEKNVKYTPVTWGDTTEDANQSYLTIGWDNVKAHFDCVDDKSFQPLLDQLRETAELEMAHASLRGYD